MNLLTFLNSEMSPLLLHNMFMMDSLKVRTKPFLRTILTSITPSLFRELPWLPIELLI